MQDIIQLVLVLFYKFTGDRIVSLDSPILVNIPYDNTGGAQVWESPGLGDILPLLY